MPKLWIVHRHPPARAALARLAGLDADQIVLGAPKETDFFAPSREAAPSAFDSQGVGDTLDAGANEPPSTIVMGLEGDFELELDFAHRVLRQRRRAGSTPAQWILLCDAAEAEFAMRLFEPIAPVVLEASTQARSLRAELARAFARGAHQRVTGLAERRARRRLADRFSSWLGSVEVPGLLRALDPALGALPLLVRGVPGSGRALTARYVELFRTPTTMPGFGLDEHGRSEGTGGPARLRIHAHDIMGNDLDRRGPADRRARRGATERLARRLGAARPATPGGPVRIWIDEVDALSPSAQGALADWIVGEEPTGGLRGTVAQWIATAGPARWQDPLEPALEQAFTPLIIEIPSLAEQPECLAPFAEAIVADWTRSLGGAPRRLHSAALEALAEQSWPGDRGEVEAVLRRALASTAREEIEVDDLGLATGARAPARAPSSSTDPSGSIEVVEAMPAAPADEATLDEAEPLIDWGRTSETVAPEGFEFVPPDPEPLHALEDEPLETDPLGAASVPPFSGPAASGPAASAPAAPAAPASATAQAEDIDESILLSEASFALAHETEESWRRLARSLAHEIRNPLVSIRTFAELLPENHQDETFRQRFVELVGRDVRHIDTVVERMQNVAKQDHVESGPVDISAMLEELLDARRTTIQKRRLLVLRELERDAPLAWAEADAVRAALAGLLDRALDSLPERGDLFVATRHIERSSEGDARLRILLRFHSPELGGGSGEFDELSPAANVLEYVLAETVARSSGGSFAIDSSDARETLILFDLKTPRSAAPSPSPPAA